MYKKLLSTRPDLFSFDIAALVFRLGAGVLILTHGIPKMVKILQWDLGFLDPIGLGPEVSLFLVTFAEVICAIFLILGLETRLAAVPLMIDLLVVSTIVHAADPFGVKEKPLLFLVLFIGIFLMGGGKYSLDYHFFGKRQLQIT